MTFEQWFEAKKQECNSVKLNKCSVIAREAWDAAYEQGKNNTVEALKMIQAQMEERRK